MRVGFYTLEHRKCGQETKFRARIWRERTMLTKADQKPCVFGRERQRLRRPPTRRTAGQTFAACFNGNTQFFADNAAAESFCVLSQNISVCGR